MLLVGQLSNKASIKLYHLLKSQFYPLAGYLFFGHCLHRRYWHGFTPLKLQPCCKQLSIRDDASWFWKSRQTRNRIEAVWI